MAVEDDQMRLEFLKDFGDSSASFTDVSAGSSSTITAMLREEYLSVDSGVEVPVESSEPIAKVRDTDVPNIVQGDTLSIFGTTYTVFEIRPDGEGMTDLRLRT